MDLVVRHIRFAVYMSQMNQDRSSARYLALFLSVLKFQHSIFPWLLYWGQMNFDIQHVKIPTKELLSSIALGVGF